MTSSLVTILLASALLVEIGAHVALLFGLARRPPRWRALVALLVPPLAPVWGWKAGMRARAVAWLVALVAYAVGVVLAA